MGVAALRLCPSVETVEKHITVWNGKELKREMLLRIQMQTVQAKV
jgi:hypothetical protein